MEQPDVTIMHYDESGNPTVPPSRKARKRKPAVPRPLDVVKDDDIISLVQLFRDRAVVKVKVKGGTRNARIPKDQYTAWASARSLPLLPKDCRKVNHDVPADAIKAVLQSYAYVSYVLLFSGRKAYVPRQVADESKALQASLGYTLSDGMDQAWNDRRVNDEVDFESYIRMVRLGEKTVRIMVSPGLNTILVSRERYDEFLEWKRTDPRIVGSVAETFGVMIVPEGFRDKEGNAALDAPSLTSVRRHEAELARKRKGRALQAKEAQDVD